MSDRRWHSLDQLRARLERLARPGGSPEEIALLIHDLDGHQLELEKQCRDLAKARGALEESRDRYADLYDRAPVGYLTLDAEGRIIELNLTAAAQLSTERAVAVGTPFQQWLESEDSIKLQSHLRKAAEWAGPSAIEMRLRGEEPAMSACRPCASKQGRRAAPGAARR